MASSSSSSPTLMKYHVFLSFRGEDSRLNFTTHLLQALKDEGLDVFFDEEKLESGEPLSQALSQAIAVSNISIIVLSADYASSKSCLAELSDIMDRYRTKQQIVLPIFYHVNPSDVENLGGSFKTSFDQHETTRSVDEVKRWKTAFAEVGKLKGWHIDGSNSDRLETTHIKGIVVYVMQKLMKHQVFLSLGEDTRLNFSNHLVNALEKVGINVFPDNETLEKGEKLPPAYVRALSASNLSVIVLSKDYASSISCLVELSDIMDRKRKPTDKRIVLPIFYHVDPSDVRHIGGSFKTSFKEHEPKQPADIVQRWKSAFAEVGKLKGWHIEGGKFDRPETEYIKDVVEYVLKKLTNTGFGSASEELVGIEYQKETILKLIKQKECRVLGLWGMGGQGKTTLAEVVYKNFSLEFESHWFLQNVREKIENLGKESLRNKLLSKLLNSDVDIGTPSIGSTFTQERLENKKVLLVLDDVDDSDHIDYMGVKHFGSGSKIIVTSRYKQVLENGEADTIHEVKALNKNDSLQLFSTFAFKQLNPTIGFQDLSCKFVEYTQGNPLALRVLGSGLYKKRISYWESEVEKLKDCPPEQKISVVLKRSYDALSELEKNIFLDIACFFKWKPIERTKQVLSCYKGAESGIDKLVSKCLIDISSYCIDRYGNIISMQDTLEEMRHNIDDENVIYVHDMLEEMGKDIARQESKNPGECSRLWSQKEVEQVLKYDKGTDRISIQGIKLNMSLMDELQLQHSVFENMINLKYIIFYFPLSWCRKNNKLLHTNQVDIIVSLPDELRYLQWDFYPFKSLPSSFNLKNLVALKISYGDMEQLWDGVQNLANLREIALSYCNNLKKMPNLSRATNLELLRCSDCHSLDQFWNEDDHIEIHNLSRAINLELLDCSNSESSVELWNEDDHRELVNLRIIDVSNCKNLRKISNLSRAINLELLDCSDCESFVELPCLNHLESLHELDLGGCPRTKFPEIPRSLIKLNLSRTQIEEVSLPSDSLCNLQDLNMSGSAVKTASIKLESLHKLDLSYCPMIKFPEIPRSLISLNLSSTLLGEVYLPSLRHKSLKFMHMDGCKSLKLLSELPPYLQGLSVHDCTSLEEVSFADQNLYLFDYLVDDDDDDDDVENVFRMLFCNCIKLNQESTNNIEANATLKIGSLAKKWASEYGWGYDTYTAPSLICCFPGNKISADKFKCQSMNSSLSLKIAPNGGSDSRFLVFAICLVADLTDCPAFEHLRCICEYQLTSAGGGNDGGGNEKFRNEISFSSLPGPEKFMGDHVFILSSVHMVDEDKNYEEASFKFKIRHCIYYDEADDFFMYKCIKVERCGVHVFYVDAESHADRNVESSENPNLNEMSSDESNDSFYSAEDDIFEEERPAGYKRS